MSFVLDFFDSNSGVNKIYPAFAKKLYLAIQSTNIDIQKIDDTTLKTYEMVVAAFSISDQVKKVRFFEEIFLVTNISPNMILEMLFLILNNADVDFLKRELWWRFYIIENALFTIKQVKLIGKKEFITAAFDPGYKTFVVHIAFFDSPSNN